MYSPIIPRKNNCTPAKKNNPIIIGARPNENVDQKINLKTKYKRDIIKQIIEIAKPRILLILKGNFEELMKPNIAMSYN